MCLAVYIASDADLPLIPWDDQNPEFNVVPIPGGEELVRAQFTKSNVAYVGSYEGCSCGFVIDPDDPGWDDEERARSVRQLGDYIDELLCFGTVELYACWNGDEGDDPVSRIEVTRDHFRTPKFWFEKKQFLTIKGNSPAAPK